MKDDFFIIYEGDEEDILAASPPAEPEADEVEPDHAMAGEERRRRALEAKERRRLERIAARDEKIRAKEEARKAREAEYARRVAEYEREKARRGKEKQAKQGSTAPKRFAGEDAPKATQKEAPAKQADSAAPRGTPAAFSAGPCKLAIPLTLGGLLIVLVGLIMFGVWYPAEWYVTMDQVDNGPVKATMATFVAGFLVMLIGNILALPSVRAARSD